MKKKLFTSLIFVILTIVSCSEDSPTAPAVTPAPTVDFSYLGANSPAPSTVSFTSITTNATNYELQLLLTLNIFIPQVEFILLNLQLQVLEAQHQLQKP